MDINTLPRKLWEHPNPKETNMWRFMQKVNEKRGLKMNVSWCVLYHRIEISKLDCWVPCSCLSKKKLSTTYLDKEENIWRASKRISLCCRFWVSKINYSHVCNANGKIPMRTLNISFYKVIAVLLQSVRIDHSSCLSSPALRYCFSSV